MHNNRLQAIAEFRRAADQPIRLNPTADIPDEEKQLAFDLIAEELKELGEAMGLIPDSSGNLKTDLIAIADALGDLQVVVEQLGPTFGLNSEAIFEEVHRSNMSKVDPATGKMPKKPNGKAGKGPLFVEPNLAKVISESPINPVDLMPSPDADIDFIISPSVSYARNTVPVSHPHLAQLDVITPTAREVLKEIRVRNVYVLPGASIGPGIPETLEVVKSQQAASGLGGKVIAL